MMLFLDLPEEATCHIAHFLPAPDVLNLVSVHPAVHRLFGTSRCFWQGLKRVHYPNNNASLLSDADDERAAASLAANNSSGGDWKQAKDAYLLQAHCNSLSTVRWYPAATGRTIRTMRAVQPTAREGHLSCMLGNYVVVTGGYADDAAVYVKDVRSTSSWQRVMPTASSSPPPPPVDGNAGTAIVEPQWAYGATLTALDKTRAVRFGGFQAGGYSSETCQVAVLHLVDTSDTMGDAALTAHWEIVPCQLPDGGVIADTNVAWSRMAARAYHAATLLFDRYILMLGGMQSSGSVLQPILLDCATWTWYSENLTTPTAFALSPSPRHGCSVVADFLEHRRRRGRLVLFGGGSGMDLLRSGHDNTEVWALDANGCASADELHASLPWKWRLLHEDQPNPEANEEEAMEETTRDMTNDPNRLSPVEKLNLGRCHGGYRVGRDTVLLAFGSGRPTANSLLGYNLARDEFFRISVCGPLPRARFTFASVFVESLGYVVFHGGFSTQGRFQALSDTVVLDLAPGMQRRQFRLWPVDARASYPAVTEEEAVASRVPDGVESPALSHIRSALMSVDEADRPATAARMFDVLQVQQRLGGRAAMFLHLVATGRAELTDDGSMRVVVDRNVGNNSERDEDEEH